MHREADSIEQRVRDEISPHTLQEHLEAFSRLFRDSGSSDEWEAARYIARQLNDYGVASEILSFDSLISWPLDGSLAVLDDEGNEIEQIPVRTRSFGAQTPPAGVEAELVVVPFAAPEQGAMIFTHRAQAGDYTGLDVTGKFVLTGDGGPDGIRRAEERGAAGHIHIWPSDEHVIHEMISTSVWGTPTPQSAQRLPSTPVLGVNNTDGNRLADMADQQTVRVRIHSNVRTEWMTLPLVVGHIPGNVSDDFLMVGAHIDSWYEGVTDNATGDASLLELARVLGSHREALHSGVRFCWWPGHSTGRYSGSTWYADNYFFELRDRALGYLNIDSPGVRETEIWDCRYNMAEVEHVTGEVVRELSGQEPNLRRPLRAGDQSFLGVGLPSLGAFRMLPVNHPDRKAVGGCGGGYWWHSPEDTLDKADAEILAADTAVYATMTLRMCKPEVPPFLFASSARDFIDYATEYQDAAGDHFDFSPVLAAARAFMDAAGELDSTTTRDPVQRRDGLKRLTRIVNPALFTIDGPYEMDPALQLPILPGLAPARQLPNLDPAGNDHRFLHTQLLRQRNRIVDALQQATSLARTLSLTT